MAKMGSVKGAGELHRPGGHGEIHGSASAQRKIGKFKIAGYDKDSGKNSYKPSKMPIEREGE